MISRNFDRITTREYVDTQSYQSGLRYDHFKIDFVFQGWAKRLKTSSSLESKSGHSDSTLIRKSKFA